MKFTDNAMSVHLLRRDNGGYQTPATTADLIACLRANPEAAAEVIRRLEPRCCADSRANLLARAEQAERARDEARALYASETGKLNLAHAKGMQFRRERDEARSMFQETRRRMCRRMGQEEGKSWSALESLASVLRARLAKAEAVVDAARTDLRTADILIEGAHAGAGGTTAERLEQATRGIRAALRALDNDSGGSGAATGNTASPVPDMPAQAGEQPGGGDTTSGDTRPPAPAGSYRVPIGCGVAAVDSAGRVIWWEPGDPLRPTPEAPATRAEVEELRVRVERLESGPRRVG